MSTVAAVAEKQTVHGLPNLLLIAIAVWVAATTFYTDGRRHVGDAMRLERLRILQSYVPCVRVVLFM